MKLGCLSCFTRAAKKACRQSSRSQTTSNKWSDDPSGSKLCLFHMICCTTWSHNYKVWATPELISWPQANGFNDKRVGKMQDDPVGSKLLCNCSLCPSFALDIWPENCINLSSMPKQFLHLAALHTQERLLEAQSDRVLEIAPIDFNILW